MKKLVAVLLLALGLSVPASSLLTISTVQVAQAQEAAPAAKAVAKNDSSSTFDYLAEFYQKGGWVMHVIAFAMAIGWAITLERMYYLYVKTKVNKHQYLSQIIGDISADRLDKAIEISSKSQAPLIKIVKAGLERAKAGDPNFADAMDQASLANIPFLERNTPYLAMIGNVSTLLGLLGTVLGLIDAFGATAYADPSQKATLLSLSISVAMNTTAFGMVVAIPALISFSVLNGKTQRTIEDIQEASAVVIEKLNKRFQKA